MLWRLGVDREKKKELVNSLQDSFEDINLMIVTHYSGLTVSELNNLRGQMRDVGASFKVTKNRLMRLALKDSKYAALGDIFSGPTAIAVSQDQVAAARVAVNFAKDNDKLIIVGGAMGEEVLSVEAITSIAKLPSLDVLRGKIVGLLKAPPSKIVGVLTAPAGQLNRVLAAYSTQ
jgi:large subunit ribosomal protein L10